MDKYNPNEPHEYDALFQQAADTHGVSYGLLRKVGWVESRFKPTAQSPTGPRGVMQFTKATGQAYGLQNDEDFNDPAKSIDAGARYLADLVKKYDGDELKAALAYNQGEGRNGKPQLEAYDSGNFANIGDEGRNYLRSLLDVAKSPKSGDIESFGGITPKAKGIPFDAAMSGIGKKGKVTTELPESHEMSFRGKEQAAPNQPFGKDYWEAKGTTLDEANERSTFFGFGNAAEAELSNSTLGVAFRAGKRDNGFDVLTDVLQPTRFNSHIWTPEELNKIRTEVKNPAYMNVVLGGSAENLDELIKIANENFEADAKAADAGLGAKLSAGLIGAGVDPLTYVPIAGTTAKGFKLVNKALVVGAQAGMLNVASEGLRTSVAGGDAHYAEAALAGMLLAGGLTAVADGVAAGLRKSGAEQIENPFAAAQMRFEARETARNTGGYDASRMPPSEDRVFSQHNGVEYAPLETEPGAVVLKDGSIISDTNLANPMTAKEFAEVDPERAAWGLPMRGLSEIGLRTLRSEHAEIRGLAKDLVRSPTGMESGSHGKFGATASDIKERLHSTNQRTYNDLYGAMKEAMSDPEWSVGMFKSGAQGARQEIYRRAAVAIERPELQANLTKAERKVMDIMKEHFDLKREMMENPSMFGNKANSIFPNSRHKGTYVPHVYSREAKQLYSQALGGSDGLQEAIAASWMTSYRSRPEVKARVDEHLAETLGIDVKAVTEEMVMKHASDKAYGIAKTDQFNSSSVIDDNIEGLVGIENNSFLEARNLFDSDMPVTLPNGQQFSVNDLRDFDMKHVMPAYDRRVDGDIAIMGGTGKTTAELKDEILALDKKSEGKGTMKGEVEALKDTVKILTGRARRNQDTLGDTMVRALSDMSFFTKNAYMGLQNLTEISGMLAKGNIRAMLHGVPALRDLAFRNKPVSGSELKELHSMVFGKEFDQLIRPSRQDIIQRLRESTDTPDVAAKVAGTIKHTTQELAARSPLTKFLNGTSNYLLDMARQGVMGDVVTHAITGKGANKWIKGDMLKSASISKEQWEGIQSLIRENVTRGEDGKFTFKDKRKLANDPRAMDLWRLADKVADETMLRPHKVSLQDSHAFGATAKLVLQFKSFVIKSMNSKFIRSGNEAFKNHRAMDMALTYAISGGIAGSYYVAQAHLKAAGLPKEQQKDYLKKALDPKMIAYAAASRSSHLGSPLSIANFAMGAAGYDQGLMVRSTILPKGDDKRERNKAVTSRDMGDSIMGAIGEQVPALGFAGATLAAGRNAYGVLTAPNKPTEREMMTGLMNAHRELIPNDPISQQMLIKFYEANGVHIKSDKK
ncbi:internal virion protein with endolysin domain [Yersinia phage PYPS50]|uniref:Peptidoglycan transglycosylase gp16 n=1 Tax=Yersinia phage PYPS50 TaxID=2321391 RepID=A0A3G8F0W2_9CAUD|nr:internal virion protein with endolysin domain [Yersinia phage PYPS50]AZF87539.1 DNA ejectosome component [Yersinia phage PYPS50]QQM13699.1 DNA ejectosome component [Yersinia phage PYps50T]QQO91353.1 peptidoglycan lytic exotransglycosylase [Yersinia phage PYps49T]